MNILILAQKEFKDGLRNRWVLAITLLLAVFAISLSYLGSASVGGVKSNPIAITVVSLASLSIFLLPLIALLLSYDAIVGEIEKGTMTLLLSYPIQRHEIILGKYLGQLLILTVATGLGYSISGLVMYFKNPELKALTVWLPYLKFMGSSILLGANFLAIGFLLSTIVKERATSAGLAIMVWLLFVLIYDLILLAILIADKGQFISAKILNILLLISPSDAFRMLNLMGDHAQFSGLISVMANQAISVNHLIFSLLAWIIFPLMTTILIFKRKNF